MVETTALQQQEMELEGLMREHEELRTTLRETHPQVQFVVSRFRAKLRAYEAEMTRRSEQAPHTTRLPAS